MNTITFATTNLLPTTYFALAEAIRETFANNGDEDEMPVLNQLLTDLATALYAMLAVTYTDKELAEFKAITIHKFAPLSLD
jgi:hypothetical protein